MEIKHLTAIKNYPSSYPSSNGFTATNEPLSIEEIVELEKKFNNSKPFPQALRELLFLAGNYCNVLDYGDFGDDNTQQELQEWIIMLLEKNGFKMRKPFYVIEMYDAGQQFLFIHLNEGDDPAVYQSQIYASKINLNKVRVGVSLSSFLAESIEVRKEEIRIQSIFRKDNIA